MNYLYKHNSRSYYDVYNAYVAAYPNKPTWLFEENSSLFDFQSELQNRVATDILYPKTRESAYGFAARCDYDPVEMDGCTGSITVVLSTVKEKTLSSGYQVGGISSSTGALVLFELTADAYSISPLLSLANALKVSMNAHAADVLDHTTAADTVNYPIATADATNLATLKTLIGALLTAYDAHDADAELGVGWVYHAAQEVSDHSLTSAAIPTTYAECVTRLSDLLSKYNTHDADSTAHGVGSVHQETTSDVDGKTLTCAVKQQKTYSSINIGTISSTDEWSDYPIKGYINIIKTSISFVIDGDTWTRVGNFDDSISTDKHFYLKYQSSGKCRFQFGDGTNGAIPSLTDVVYATFSVTEGLNGRLNAGEITVNVGGDSDISAITNAANCTGGNDSESVSSIIRNARANARLRYMVWSKEDLETAATQASTSCVKALGIPGLGTASIYIVKTGGVVPDASLKTTVDDYVTALTQFGTVPITILDPSFVTTNITGTITVRSGFTSATVIDLVEFACTLVLASNDSEVIEHYNDYGVDSCRTNVINSLWAWAFTEDENDALETIIEKWKTLLGNNEARVFGQDVEVGDIWSIVNELYEYGVDVFSLTAPTANVTIGSTEISNPGTITIT